MFVAAADVAVVLQEEERGVGGRGEGREAVALLQWRRKKIVHRHMCP